MAILARSRDKTVQPAHRRASWKLLAAPVVVLAAAAGLAFAADAAFAARALPGVTVGGTTVGTLDAAAMRLRLETEVAAPWAASTVTLRDGDRSWRTTNGELAIAPDIDAAVAQALAFGKTGSIIDRAGAWIDAFRGSAAVPFAMRANGDALARWVAAVSRDVDRPSVAGDLRLTAAGLEVTHPLLGREVDKVSTVAALLSADSLASREVALRVRTSYPTVDASGFDAAYAKAQAAVTPLTITVEDRTWSESPVSLSTLLVIERVAAKPGELPAIPAEAIAPTTRYRFEASLANERVATWVAALGKALDHPGRSAKFSVNADGVVSIIPSESGVVIDQEKLRALILEELIKPASSGARAIAAPAAVDASAFTTEKAKELLPNIQRTSSFTTYYPGDRSRHANISTGSSQFDGVVIMPGQTFSFWELLGPVTVERGYAFAGAIIDGRSHDDVIGGGLCQVSTTIFNSVSRVGYEIVERHEHGYYIDRYPIGYDAAVFEPGLDLRWRNDTPNPVFLWSWNSATSVTIEVWGIPTGRTVVISDPVQRNFVKPAANQPADPHFPRGVVVDGRDVFRTRTVYENGAVLHRDNFASHYAPVWGGPALPPPTTP